MTFSYPLLSWEKGEEAKKPRAKQHATSNKKIQKPPIGGWGVELEGGWGLKYEVRAGEEAKKQSLEEAKSMERRINQLIKNSDPPSAVYTRHG